MNGIILLMLKTKTKNAIMHSLIGPMESGITSTVVERAVELANDFSVPVVHETHEISKLVLLKLCNDSIHRWIIHILKIVPSMYFMGTIGV
jgi:hypothetical protein